MDYYVGMFFSADSKAYKKPVLAFGFFLIFFWGITGTLTAQQQTVTANQVESLDEFYILPDCVRTFDEYDGCIAAIFKLPEGIIANYSEETRRFIQRSERYSHLGRSRTGQVFILSLPPVGGDVEISQPGESLENNIINVEGAEPGSVVYFEIEITAAARGFTTADRRARRAARMDRDDRGAVAGTVTRDEEEDRRKTEPAEREMDDTSYRDVPRQTIGSTYLISLNYMHFIRNTSNLYRGSNLFSQTNGDGLSVSLHYMNGFRSARIGISYLESSGIFNSITSAGEITENVSHSHISLFLSYSPVIQLFGDRISSGYLFTDIGAGINYLDHSYSDVEEIINPTYREIITYRYDVEEEILPSVIGGVGFIYTYQNIGLNFGVHYEGIYDYDAEAFLNTIYPRVGINITL